MRQKNINLESIKNIREWQIISQRKTKNEMGLDDIKNNKRHNHIKPIIELYLLI